MLRSKPKPPPARPDRSAEFTSFTPTRTAPAVMRRIDQAPAPVAKVAPKALTRVVQAIRDSAKGEECLIRISGVCNFNPETTVWCHLPGIDGDRGMGLKAIDHCGAFGCSACHDVLDMRAKLPAGLTREQVLLDFFFGHMRSLVRLSQKGLL